MNKTAAHSSVIADRNAIARRVTLGAATAEAQQLLAAIAESSEDAILSSTLAGVILTRNRGAEAVFGHPAKDAIGKHVSLLMAPERLSDLAYFTGQVSRGIAVSQFESLCLRQDGTRFHVSVTGPPLVDSDGAVVAMSAVLRDVSERREALGCAATAVTNGAEAVEAVERAGCDLVLMDCQMPVMDGFEATRRIRHSSQPDRTGIPIVAVTADALSDDRARCLSEGMNDYLAKPVELSPLRNAVAKWLRKSGAPETSQPPGQLTGEPPKAIFDAEALLRRLMGDGNLRAWSSKGSSRVPPLSWTICAPGSLRPMSRAPGSRRTESRGRRRRLPRRAFAPSPWPSSGRETPDSWSVAAIFCRAQSRSLSGSGTP